MQSLQMIQILRLHIHLRKLLNQRMRSRNHFAAVVAVVVANHIVIVTHNMATTVAIVVSSTIAIVVTSAITATATTTVVKPI